MITGSSKKKTTCELLLGAGSNQQSHWKTRGTKVVCFFKGGVIEKHSRFYIIPYQESWYLPPPPPPPCQAFVWVQATARQKAVPCTIGGNFKAVVQAWEASRQSCWRGGGRPGEGGGEDHIVFQMTEQGFIYQLAFFTWRRKVITAQTRAFETVSCPCPVNNGIGEKERSDWMS